MAEGDTPIVDVPISGGVKYGEVFGGDGDQPSDPGGGDAWASYVWFSPIAMFCSNPATLPADCSFWCSACGGDIVPTLVNLNDLDPVAPQYPSFTPLNIAALGLCQIFEDWMWSSFWASQTGGTENPPNIPAPYNPGGTGG